MESRKGISDVIAVVLMIAVAISIGVFVTTFATKWVQDQTSSPSISCALKTNYIVADATFNLTGRDILQVKITNKGEDDLYGFGFVIENITKILTFNSTNSLMISQVLSTTPLKREQSAFVSLNMTSCMNATSLYCNQSSEYAPLVKTAQKITITNFGCRAVSASTGSVAVS